MLDNIKRTGIGWNQLDDAVETWRNFKLPFIEAYGARLDSDPTTAVAGYHGAATMLKGDNSLGSNASSISQMQLANNANTKAMVNSILLIMALINELRQALLATQQQLAVLA